MSFENHVKNKSPVEHDVDDQTAKPTNIAEPKTEVAMTGQPKTEDRPTEPPKVLYMVMEAFVQQCGLYFDSVVDGPGRTRRTGWTGWDGRDGWDGREGLFSAI